MSWKLTALVLVITALFGVSTQAQTADEYFRRGTDAIKAKNYGIAIKELTAYLELKPAESTAYYNRGIAYKAGNNRQRALADFSKAIEIDPKFANAYEHRALLYRLLGKPNLAMADHDRAIELLPNDASYYFNRGIVHMEQSRREAGLKDFDRAIQLDDKVAKYYSQRAEVQTGLRNWAASVADFYTAIRLDPSLHRYYYPLAWMEMHIGNDQAAYENAVRYLEANGLDTDRAAFTLVAGYLAQLRAGNRLEAERFAIRFRTDATPGVLPAKILQFFRDDLSEADLLAEAGSDQMKLTDTRSLIGLKYLAEGKIEAALPHLRWVKEKGRNSPATYALAVIELEKLERNKNK